MKEKEQKQKKDVHLILLLFFRCFLVLISIFSDSLFFFFYIK